MSEEHAREHSERASEQEVGRAGGRRWSRRRWAICCCGTGCAIAVAVTVAASILGGTAAEVAAEDREADAPSLARPENDPLLAPRLTEAREDSAKAEERRRTSEAGEKRERSRGAYRDQTDEEALSLVREKFAPIISQPLWQPPIGPGDRVERYVDDNSAIVEGAKGDKPTLLESTIPLRAPDGSGPRERLDLDLDESRDGFEPENAVTEIRLPKDLDDGLALPNSGIEVHPVSPGAGTESSDRDRSGQQTSGGPKGPDEAREVENKLFWANTDTDTDFFVAPLPAGFETFHQLRSVESPEALEFAVTAPEGFKLRPSDAPPGGVEIMDDRRPLASISPPAARDAQGAVVPTRFEIEGENLRLHVEHRKKDVAYPLLVDPSIMENQQSWESNLSLDTTGWRFLETGGPNGDFANFVGTSTSSRGRGLYTYMRRNQFYDGWATGQWSYPSPGDTYIIRTDHSGVDLDNYARGCVTAGANDAQGWEPGRQEPVGANDAVTGAAGAAPWTRCDVHFYNHNRRTYIDQPARGNFSSISLSPLGASGASPDQDLLFMGGAATQIVDDLPPRDLRQTGLPPSDQWVSSLVPKSVRVEAADGGFGMERLELSTPGWRSWGSQTLFSATDPCRGDRNAGTKRCPASQALEVALPEDREGTTEYRLDARDWLDNTSSASWSVNIDKTAPTFNLLGAVLPDARLGPAQHRLRVEASDIGQAGAKNSGVKRVEYAIDGGTPVVAAPNCAGGPCSQGFDIDATSAGLAEGSHSIRVVATDGVGRSSEQTFNVVVDRSAPVLRVGGSFRTSEFIKAQSYGLEVDASDPNPGSTAAGTGVDSAEVLVGGVSRAKQTCSSGVCSPFTLDGGALPEGPQAVEVVAADAAGNRSTERFQVLVDRSAPVVDVYGRGRDQSGLLLTDSAPVVRVDAFDGDTDGPRSGVRTIEVLVDGQRGAISEQQSPGQCVQEEGNCPLSRDFYLRPDKMAAGDHQVRVAVQDMAGHTFDDSWSVKTERTAPVLEAQGDLRTPAARWFGTGARELNVAARDDLGSGIRRVELTVDGRLIDAVEQGCPSGGCPITRDFSVEPSAYPTGEHEMKVRATDFHGNAAEDSWPIRIDATPPELALSGSLFAAAGRSLDQAEYQLDISASDGDIEKPQSGARNIEVLVDGARADFLEAPCAADSCSLTRSFTYRPVLGDSQAHEVTVISTDKAGQVARRSWTVNNPSASGGAP